MREHGLLWALMILSCVSLMGLGLSGMLVSKAQQAKAKRDARMAAVSSPHTKVQRIEISAFTRPAPVRNLSLPTMAAALFGFDLDKPEQYPLRWYIILLITLTVAKVAQSIGESVVGNLSYLAIPVIWVFLSRTIFGWAQSKRKLALLRQLPDVLAMIVRSVRVGIPVMEAIRAVAREMPEPTAPEFARLVDQLSIGVALDEAVLEMARRCGIPEYRFFATARSLQNQTGGTLSDTLENLADVIRKRVALAAKGKALASEARTSAMVLTALPIVTGIAQWALSPKYIDVLFTDKIGNAILGGAVLSLCVGSGIIKMIIRKSLS
jgi:tight adherence protein B